MREHLNSRLAEVGESFDAPLAPMCAGWAAMRQRWKS